MQAYTRTCTLYMHNVCSTLYVCARMHVGVCVILINLIWCSSFCGNPSDAKEVGDNVMFSTFCRTGERSVVIVPAVVNDEYGVVRVKLGIPHTYRYMYMYIQSHQ